MGTTRTLLLARVLLAATFVGTATSIALYTLTDAGFSGGSQGAVGLTGDLIWATMFLAFGVAGYVIASRQPRNAMGWIMLAIGVIAGAPLHAYGAFAITAGLPLAEVALALDSVSWLPAIGLAGPMLIFLFPDGRPASPRWRPVVWGTAVLFGLLWVTLLLSADLFAGSEFEHLENPFAVDAIQPIAEATSVLVVVLPVSLILACVSMVLRYRRSHGVERQQLKWLTAAAVVAASLFAIAIILSIPVAWGGPDTPTWLVVLQTLVGVGFLLIPAAIGLAVARFHLYDIDLVINRAVVLGLIVAFITSVYLALVVGVGALIGRGDSSNTLLAVVATAVVAIAFQPIRSRARRLADRLVYGNRATAEEVLSAYVPQGFADRLVAGEAGTDEELETTVLFSDLRGFSSLAEHLSPRALVDLVGIHLAAMAEVVQEHGGMVDKFQGDAVMAVFGVTVPREQHPARALQCAIAMQERQASLNADLDSRQEPLLHMGVGVNTGQVVAGTIGGGGRLEFTVVGDAVNIAQRLEGMADGGEVLATMGTVRAAGDGFTIESLGLLPVKGREAPVDVCRIMLSG